MLIQEKILKKTSHMGRAQMQEPYYNYNGNAKRFVICGEKNVEVVVLKGSKLLKVSAILMIIGSVVMVITGIIAVIGVGAVALLLETGAAILTISAVLCLVSGICSLIAGIVGVKNANKPRVTNKCIFWGALVAVLSLAGNFIGVAAGSKFNFLNLVTGLGLPVLYIIGAVNNNTIARELARARAARRRA